MTNLSMSVSFPGTQDVLMKEHPAACWNTPESRWKCCLERITKNDRTRGRRRGRVPRMVSATTGSVPASPWNIPAGGWVPPSLDVGPGATEDERAGFLQKMEKSVAALEFWLGSPDARDLEPKQYAFVRAQARLLLAQCDVVLAAMEEGRGADAVVRRQVGDLCDRLDEIVDTLGWSAEAGDKLAQLLRDDMCA